MKKADFRNIYPEFLNEKIKSEQSTMSACL